MPIPLDETAQLIRTKEVLARTPAIQNACNLDLIVFLHRYPHALLTTDQLAGYIGYNLKDIAQSLDAFIEAGLLARTTQQSSHAARLFVLLLHGPQGDSMNTLFELAKTRLGRKRILDVLAPKPVVDLAGARPDLRLINFTKRAIG